MAKNSERRSPEAIIGAMAVGVIGLSILSMLATLLMVFIGVEDLPVILAQLPLIGLPAGFLLIIALLISAIIRRRKETEGN